MNFVRLTQHNALQSYVAQAVHVGLTVYSQFLGALFQRLREMTTQSLQLVKMANNQIVEISSVLMLAANTNDAAKLWLYCIKLNEK